MNRVLIGAQWGDEGKGKVIDILARKSDVIVRYQGGHNAGHTVKFGKKKFVLHLIPSGIFNRGKICVIGGGVVLNPHAFLEEVHMLEKAGIKIIQIDEPAIREGLPLRKENWQEYLLPLRFLFPAWGYLVLLPI